MMKNTKIAPKIKRQFESFKNGFMPAGVVGLAWSFLGSLSSQANPSLLPAINRKNEGNPASLVYPRASTVCDRSQRVVQELTR